MIREKEHGRPYAPGDLVEPVTTAVADAVRQQVGAGVDVVTDGELSKASVLTCVKDRLVGFDASAGERLMPGGRRVPSA